MFVSSAKSLPVPLETARRRVRQWLMDADLGRAAFDAMDDGHRMTTRAGIGAVTKKVKVQTVEPYDRRGTFVLPFRWEAEGAAGHIFPALDANLEVWPEDAGTKLVLVGSYRPPLGSVGQALDAIALHKVADATIRGFLQQIAVFVAADEPACRT